VVVRDKRGYVPLRKTSKNRIWDCGLLGSTHRIVFGGKKLWKQLRSSRGTRHDDDDDSRSRSGFTLYTVELILDILGISYGHNDHVEYHGITLSFTF